MDVIRRFALIALPILLLLMTAIVVPMKLFDHRGFARVERLGRELSDLEAENQRLIRENEKLRTQIRLYRSDPGFVEKIARDELGMVGPDEIIYQFPEAKRSPAPVGR